MKNSEQPAHPTPDCEITGTALQYLGLTKREYFAAMAMQGRLAASTSVNGFYLDSDSDSRIIAKDAVAFADALLTELEKSKP